jgi:hypothetical protein
LLLNTTIWPPTHSRRPCGAEDGDAGAVGVVGVDVFIDRTSDVGWTERGSCTTQSDANRASTEGFSMNTSGRSTTGAVDCFGVVVRRLACARRGRRIRAY